MAVSIPSSLPKDATKGEKKVHKYLMERLSEKDILYYGVKIGNKTLDFLLISENYGLIVFEVKDYLISQISFADQHTWSLVTDVKKTRESPYKQARSYSFDLAKKLEKNHNLVQINSSGSKLKIPYTYVVFFTNITSFEALTNGLSDIVEFEKTMYEDDFNWGKDELSDFISNSFPVYRKQLSNEEINNIRYTIFPEIRIGKPSVIKDENGLHKLRNIIAMDLYQESLAKSIGLGPRLIRGVAGSGKTLILSSNAKHRALTNPSKKILVLCYGSVMCSKLISLIFNTGQIDNIEILTFSQYLQKYFKVYDLLNVNRLCDMIEDNFSDSPTFDFIYVEEGQDFESDWFRLLSLSLNKELNSLFIVEDKAQDIYRRKGSLKSLTGLDFRGRSRNLKINYRNTKEIASFAWEFFKNNSILSEDIILPESTIRSGKLPELFDCYSLEEEIDKIISIIKEKIEQGFSYSDISILYRSKILDKVDYIQPLTECLNLNNIPFVWLTKDKLSKKDISNLVGNNVILSTIDSAKGLDFPIIVLYESGMLPFKLEKDIQREVSLMYIALTRATQELYLTYSKDSPFLESMRKII
jgi:hypothetical protein